MFEQEYHTLCLGDEMPEISFHPETSSLTLPDDDFANPECPFKMWSLDDTLEEVLNRNQSCVSPHQITLDDMLEQELVCRNDQMTKKVCSEQNKGMLSELQTVESTEDRMELICPICDKSATSFNKLFSHMLNHSGKLQCGICDKTFANRSHLCLHIQRHMKIRPHCCQECTFTSTDKHDLIPHIKRHRNERKFECTFCKKKFFRRVEFNYHVKDVHLHNDIKQCKLCKFSTYSRNILNHHNISKHQMKKSFHCYKCQRIFQHKHSLIIHMRTHTGEKPYSCTKCNKPFKSKSELSCHSKVHEVPSVSCAICKRKFSRKSNLLQHMAIHTKKKRHSCTLCPYSSFWKSTLERHIRIVHKITSSATAELNHVMNDKKLKCDTNIETASSDKETEQSIHEKIDQQYTSNETLNFGSKNTFYLHLKLQQLHSCKECNKVFKRKSELNSHLYVHKEKSFECEICSRKFKTRSNLNRHSNCHTNLKPYSCKFCPYVSNLKTSVTRHVMSQHSGKTQSS